MTATSDHVAICAASQLGWSRAWAGSVERGQVAEMDGVLLATTGTPQEWWNEAIVTKPLRDAERTLRRAVAWFEERSQPFIMRIRDGLDPAAERAAEALGFDYTDTLPGMVLAPIPAAPEPPSDVEIRLVTDRSGLDGCATVISEAYEMDVDVTRRLIPLGLVTRDGWATFVGYAGGEPAATATVAETDGIAGITFVGTRPSFRKRGFAEAVTWRAIAEGASRGCSAASLEASEMGFPIYQRMGFRHVTGFKTFVLPKYRS